jgi:uncharacterized protein YeaO (DUF488 family)
MADRLNKPRIFEGYIANWKSYPKDEVKVRVARPNVLAPSQELLGEFNRLKRMYGRERAWELSRYEERFKREILNNPEAMAKLKEIRELAKNRSVRLICYEKNPPCHRFILMKLIEEGE